MGTDRERLADLFDELSGLTAARRAERLRSIRSGSPALADELESLLAAHAAAGDFLDRLDADRAAELLHESVPSSPPERAGPWRIIREIGRGGLGVVYLGERDTGDFEQRAAVKLIKRGMDSDLILKRFHHERRILASLEHPNIARLIDGGMLEDGRPYFAMEYIDGTPLTEWCDGRRVTINDRLRLFEQICAAVQYAHARLIVHRDLKPANILVTTDGTVKLLDFGIAKLLDNDNQHDTVLTIAGTRAMTPEYAAPEQLRGEPISVATDVYALGVVLYELLAGRHPFSGDTLTRDKLARAICDTDPARPSQAVTGEQAEHVADARSSRPATLKRRLHGDLDNVVLMAMTKEPSRRYGSAEALAGDVRRHLTGMPVRARQETTVYRVSRFVCRHRLGVAATAAVMVALASGLAAALWQADRAGREARQAQAVQRFVVGIFEGANPTRTLGETITARELLDQGARALRDDTLPDPTVRAELADTLARTYLSLGLLDEAAAWSDEAIAGFQAALGDRHRRTALAELTGIEVDVLRGAVDAARDQIEPLLTRLHAAFGAVSPEHLRARSVHAAVLSSAGDFEGSLAQARAVLEVLQRSYGETHMETLEQAGRVGSTLAMLSRYDEAERILSGALREMERAGAADSPQGIYLRHQLGMLVDRMGRAPEAIVILEQALEAAGTTLGPRHPRRAQILIELGFLYGQQRREEASETALNEAIAILEPWGHYDTGSALRYLGYIHQNREHWDKAFDSHRRAEKFIRDQLGDDHPLTWAAVVTRANAQAKAGNPEAALPDLIEAVAALERLHGTDSGDVRVPRKLLGDVLRMAGRADEAERLHRWALDFERALFGDDDTIASASTRLLLARDLLASERPESLREARQLADQAMAALRRLEAGADRHAAALSVSGQIAVAERDTQRARRELAEAIDLFLTLLDEDAPSVVEARRHLESVNQSGSHLNFENASNEK